MMVTHKVSIISKKGEKCIILLGGKLRKYKQDKLLKLLNFLKDDMSLVVTRADLFYWYL